MAGESLAKRQQKTVRDELAANVWTGIVTGTDGDLVLVSRDGEAAVAYPRLASYSSPTTDDEVRVMFGVVMGEVLRTPA